MSVLVGAGREISPSSFLNANSGHSPQPVLSRNSLKATARANGWSSGPIIMAETPEQIEFVEKL